MVAKKLELPKTFKVKKWQFFLTTAFPFIVFLGGIVIYFQNRNNLFLSLGTLFLLICINQFFLEKLDFTSRFIGDGSLLTRESFLLPTFNKTWDLSKASSYSYFTSHGRYGGSSYWVLYDENHKQIVELNSQLYDFSYIYNWANQNLTPVDPILKDIKKLVK